MNRNIAIAIVVVGLLALTAVAIGPAVIEFLEGVLTGDDTSMSTLVEFHDADGNLIDVPMAITAGGQEVTTISVTASWTVEGENIQDNTFNLHGEIKIGLVNQDTLRVVSLDSYAFDSSNMVSSVKHTWTLADLLPMEDKDIGWILEIKAVLTPTATDLEGNPVEPGASTTSPISATLSWDSQTGALSIIQCAVTKAYP